MSKRPRRLGGHAKSAARDDAAAETDLTWIDHFREGDVDFTKKVDARLNLLRLGLRNKLRLIRVEKQISQADLARLTRLSQPYIAKLETGGIHNPELKTLARIAIALELDLLDLLTDPMTQSDAEAAMNNHMALLETPAGKNPTAPPESSTDTGDDSHSSALTTRGGKMSGIGAATRRAHPRRRIKTRR